MLAQVATETALPACRDKPMPAGGSSQTVRDNRRWKATYGSWAAGPAAYCVSGGGAGPAGLVAAPERAEDCRELN